MSRNQPGAPQRPTTGAAMDRRHLLRLLAATPIAGLAWSPEELADAHRQAEAARVAAAAAGAAFEPAFFTAREYRTVQVLADLILPADERSGSASDVGVPEFMDFMMLDRPSMQEWMRGGLAWLDRRAQVHHEHRFADCPAAAQAEILDAIAWPQRAAAEDSQGVAFFNRFRDLTASGFWTSQAGVEDLDYRGNRYRPGWTGCPDEVLEHLGLAGPPARSDDRGSL